MISVEVANRSGAVVDETGALELIERVLHAEGIGDGEIGLAFVGAEEIRALKRERGRQGATARADEDRGTGT